MCNVQRVTSNILVRFGNFSISFCSTRFLFVNIDGSASTVEIAPVRMSFPINPARL